MRNILPKTFIGSVSVGPAVYRRSLGSVKGGPFACEELEIIVRVIELEARSRAVEQVVNRMIFGVLERCFSMSSRLVLGTGCPLRHEQPRYGWFKTQASQVVGGLGSNDSR